MTLGVGDCTHLGSCGPVGESGVGWGSGCPAGESGSSESLKAWEIELKSRGEESGRDSKKCRNSTSSWLELLGPILPLPFTPPSPPILVLIVALGWEGGGVRGFSDVLCGCKNKTFIRGVRLLSQMRKTHRNSLNTTLHPKGSNQRNKRRLRSTSVLCV